VRGARVDFEFAAAQLSPKMLAQRLLVDRQMLGDVGLSEAESRSALDEGALFGSRHIFGGHFPLLIALLRDARVHLRKARRISSIWIGSPYAATAVWVAAGRAEWSPAQTGRLLRF
jgi:hypothetical protein